MTTVLFWLGLIGGLFGAILVNLIASDLFEWGRRWAELLVRYASTRWPPEVRERLLEEWLAELDHTPGMFWRIKFAVSLVVKRAPRSVTPRTVTARTLPPIPGYLTWWVENRYIYDGMSRLIGRNRWNSVLEWAGFITVDRRR